MLQSTRGVVIRNIKYGETSYVSHIYTKAFGMQVYMIQGVRSGSKKGSMKAATFQIGSVLDMIVYHTPHKNMQRIKEVKTDFTFTILQNDIVKNCITQYIAELLYQTIDNQEQNEELYLFIESTLCNIVKSESHTLSNFPILFTWHYAAISGFSLQNNYCDESPFLHLKKGAYEAYTEDEHLLNESLSFHIHKLLLNEDEYFPSPSLRYEILLATQRYIQLHMKATLRLKSIEIIHEILHN